ncbi:auxin efflux carrier [Sediminibacillus dalangtanensis]|uniref:Auxin efflux carrier n=1 Tax=Sediminibacillus dalangtanensis TaxID=2729421 RepID=A0ABX7VXM2_9BACI|nr:AEC family transporter [Sediminibacillus dalangtanensis]QTN00511.1 auxin efflux carrier [Sediminibacillus dalangtanensis]
MEFQVITSTIVVMGIIIFLGSMTAVKVPITDSFKDGVMYIILNIAVPAVILDGVFNTDISNDLFEAVFLIFSAAILLCISALFFSRFFAMLFRFDNQDAKKLSVLASFGNTGFIGIPLCALIFGPTGGLLAAIFDAGLGVVIFSFGIVFLQSKKGRVIENFRAFINMPIISVIVGLLLLGVGFDPPGFLRQLTEMLAALSGPLAMLYVGLLIPPLLSNGRFKLYGAIWFPLVMRLAIIPISTAVVLSFMPLSSLLDHIILLQASMPTFTLSVILFSKYTDESDKAIITTIVSTILSMFTIPLLSLLVS